MDNDTKINLAMFFSYIAFRILGISSFEAITTTLLFGIFCRLLNESETIIFVLHAERLLDEKCLWIDL